MNYPLLTILWADSSILTSNIDFTVDLGMCGPPYALLTDSIGIQKFRRNWKKNCPRRSNWQICQRGWHLRRTSRPGVCCRSKETALSICSSLFLLHCYRHLPDNTRDYSSRIENPPTLARTRNETFLRRTRTINRSIIFQTVWRQPNIEMISNKIRVWILVNLE